MQWKVNKNGEVRERSYFALFPICSDDTWHWLERVTVKEKYFKNLGWIVWNVKPADKEPGRNE
ncbi:MAG TPA: hypothetical protein VMV86_03595 [Methanosarcinales archaeon]|nr:hypothetical protein [Methanosarcinales archaeon]